MAAVPRSPPIKKTSTSIVGFPRESRISRATTSSIVVNSLSLLGMMILLFMKYNSDTSAALFAMGLHDVMCKCPVALVGPLETVEPIAEKLDHTLLTAHRQPRSAQLA